VSIYRLKDGVPVGGTNKQLLANRENAKKGGVKTERGKAISRFNAVKHGIFTNVIIADMEEGEVLDQVRAKLFDEFKPEGVLEEILVDRTVVCIWRLRRCAITDKAITEQEYHQEMDINRQYVIPSSERTWISKRWVINHVPTELLLRYETTIERQLYRVIRELRELQRIRFETEKKTLGPT